ncbi:7,8-didemethyl-8-hydroxy-5-deazariboflavin synthase CofG [Oceanospirillum maris]|uniref:7,8-didemethyl-8-hydroxy-5-deazariboflavin synthase CofG n=1 Tax=Oceanospirillum maris TaxID=64977 RepID=UPI0003FC9837|nr:7,8-didemethyl-8-hydroxy-5-deazariboflavin synthase CofG [Oceanospirillum maris]
MIHIADANRYKNATGPDLYALCEQASAVRDAQWGKQVTYSPKVFLPLTNMCRDTCGYCTFVQNPDSPTANYMTPEQVLAVAKQGEAAGCTEALFSLGEKPEQRHLKAREWLEHLGYASTLDYLQSQCDQVLEHTQLLPHINAGALTKSELASLKPYAASMGMMLENSSINLMKSGQAHYGCPDKTPKRRTATLEAAGELGIAFTTGLLIGIGESWEDRVESLVLIRDIHQTYGHIQEVIIQNFRAKPGTAMAGCAEPDLDEMKRTLAIARLILPPEISLQAPPNLEQEYGAYLSAGINDWGGISPVTRDFINPERAWPQIQSLDAACRGRGYQLSERLTIYPEFQSTEQHFLVPALQQRVHGLNQTNLLSRGLVA